MEGLYLEVPSMERREDIIDYIKELFNKNSRIIGTGGLENYLDDYEGWLLKLQRDSYQVLGEEKVSEKTYFLVRETDSKIVGMVHIKLFFNKKIGNISYNIRPSERNRGYHKINLCFALEFCQKYGIDDALLEVTKDDVPLEKEFELENITGVESIHQENNSVIKKYRIYINDALDNLKKKGRTYQLKLRG